MRALFISHESDVLPGHLGEAAERHGYTVDVCDLWDGGVLGDPADHQLIVPLGSAEAAYDDTVPWLATELDYLRRASDAGVPVFGVCFGAQAVARALGGSVRRAPRPEIGWYRIRSSAPDLIAPGPWLEWHFDTLTPPSGARILARSAAGVQAYAVGRHLGVQFHPEVTGGILALWAAAAPEELVRAGVDVGRLLDETRRRAPRARAAAHLLFDRVAAYLEPSRRRSR